LILPSSYFITSIFGKKHTNSQKRKIKMHKIVHQRYPSFGRRDTKSGKNQTTFANVKRDGFET